MKVTISDVAKLAGVSTATVSHTINNTRYVSNETKEKVYRAIEELGYTPDASARSFRTGKKKIIGFIVPDIANKFFATMIESVEKYLSANGYQLIIANTRENMDREETNIRLLTAGLVDGLLVAIDGLEVGHADGGVLLCLKDPVHQHHRKSCGDQGVEPLEIVHGAGHQQPRQ